MLIAVLLAFHIYLISEDRTTYEFIVRRREAKEDRKNAKKEQAESFSRSRNYPSKSNLKRSSEEKFDVSQKDNDIQPSQNGIDFTN